MAYTVAVTDYIFADDEGDTKSPSLSYPQTKILIFLSGLAINAPDMYFDRELTDSERAKLEDIGEVLCQLWENP